MRSVSYQEDGSGKVLDTQLREVNGTAVFVSDTQANVGIEASLGGVTIKRAITWFSTTDLPNDVCIVSAIFRVVVRTAADGDSAWLAVGGSETWNTAGSFPTWDHKADGVSWATAGGSAVGPTVNLGTMPTSTGAVEFEVKDIVKWCRDNTEGDRQVVIVLKHLDESTDPDSISTRAADYGTAGDRPKLTLTYVTGKGAIGHAVFYSSGRRRRRRRAGRKH